MNSIKLIDSSILKSSEVKDETLLNWEIAGLNFGALIPPIVNCIWFELNVPVTLIVFVDGYVQPPETTFWKEHAKLSTFKFVANDIIKYAGTTRIDGLKLIIKEVSSL